MPYTDDFTDPVRRNTPAGWAAVISDDVTTEGEDLFVTIQGIDEGLRRWGPCRWSPQVTASGDAEFPSEGDIGLVVKDNEGEYWLLKFWTHG